MIPMDAAAPWTNSGLGLNPRARPINTSSETEPDK